MSGSPEQRSRERVRHENGIHRREQPTEQKIISILDAIEQLKKEGGSDLATHVFGLSLEHIHARRVAETGWVAELEREFTSPQKTPNEKNIQRLRGLIRALSNFPPKMIDMETALNSIDQDFRFKNEKWKDMEDAVRAGVVGKDLELATRAIEKIYHRLSVQWSVANDPRTKAEIEKELNTFRSIRDLVYGRRLYPQFSQRAQR
jgi:hypothetical protein